MARSAYTAPNAAGVAMPPVAAIMAITIPITTIVPTTLQKVSQPSSFDEYVDPVDEVLVFVELEFVDESLPELFGLTICPYSSTYAPFLLLF